MSKPGGGKRPDMFAQFDKNKDGRVDSNELPAQMKPMLGKVDADKNGSIDRAEWTKFQKKMSAGAGRPKQPRPGS